MFNMLVKLFCVSLMFAVFVFLSFNAYTYFNRTADLVQNGVRTQGKIIANQKAYRPGRRSTLYANAYRPIISYQDGKGQSYKFTAKLWSDDPYKIGTITNIIFLPGKPSVAVLDRGYQNWTYSLFLILLPFGLMYIIYTVVKPAYSK